jgi:hypothetical protein
MTDDDNRQFTCTICLSYLQTPTLLCGKCSTSWHQECIDQWRATHPACPVCRSVEPPLRNMPFDRLLEFVLSDMEYRCSYCGLRLSERAKMPEHFALCPAYVEQQRQQVLEKCATIWALARKEAPQGCLRLKLEAKSVLLEVPDRREKPTRLCFQLNVQPHQSSPDMYRLQLAADEKELVLMGVLEIDGAPEPFSLTFKPPRMTLWKGTAKQRVARLWIYGF